MTPDYVIYRCRECGSSAFAHEEIWHLRNKCPGLKDPHSNIERVTLEPVRVDPLPAADTEGRDAA